MLVLEKSKIQTREDAIIKWYEEVFPRAAAYIQRRGGDLETAKEVFQEAIVHYYEKRVLESFEPAVSDSAYLMGIVKNRWLKHLQKFKIYDNLEGIEKIEENDQEPMAKKILEYLKQSGEHCMDLLQSFYYEKFSLQQIADRFGYTSIRSATVGKYKCLEKVRNKIKQKSLSYEDFLN